MKHVIRNLARWSLSLHIYVSMAGFILVLLFAVTGLTLNHDDFGIGEPKISNSTISLPPALLQTNDKDSITAGLRGLLGVRSPVTRYRADSDEIDVTFTAPGGRTVVTIDRAKSTAEVEIQSRGILGKLDDLHKGLDSGIAWRGVIDVAAILLACSSITGITLLLTLPKRRLKGFLTGAVVWAVLIGVYYLWVPR